MKVLIINLPYYIFFDKFTVSNFPLNLAHLSAILKKENIKFDVLDLLRESVVRFGAKKHNQIADKIDKKISLDYLNFLEGKIREKIRKNKYFLVAMNGDMPYLLFALSRFIKSIDSKIKIVVGGHLASKFYPVYLSKEQIDFVIFGESELSFKDLTLALKNKKPISKIRGLIYKSNDNIIKNPYSPISNLDIIPNPYMECFDTNFYFSIKKIIPIISARGCDGKCVFCGRSYFSPKRFRNPESIIKEIEEKRRKFKCDYFLLYDNMLNMNKDHLIQICNLLLEKKINIKWNCWLKGENLDFETLKLMKEAGCHAVSFGVESGSQGILNMYKKGVKLENLRKILINCKRVGVEVRTSFIYNFPSETLKDISKSFKFIVQARPKHIAFFNLDYDPTSEIYSNVEHYCKDFFESEIFISPRTKMLNFHLKKFLIILFKLSYRFIKFL